MLLFISLHALEHLEKIQKSAALSSSWYLEHLVSQVSYPPPQNQIHCKHILQDATLTEK